MTKPIRKVEPGRGCDVPNCSGLHYGNNLCRKHYKQARLYAAKSELVSILGGVCVDCGGSFHPSVMDFHHMGDDEKEKDVSKLLSGSIAVALVEARKCVLLCANCHRLRHYSNEISIYAERLR